MRRKLVETCRFVHTKPITTPCCILTHLRYIAVENIVRKGEIACNKQFLLFSQYFLPYMTLSFHFECTLKCRLQFVSIFDQSKILSSRNGFNLEMTSDCFDAI